MWAQLAHWALERGLRLKVQYDGYNRVVEVHTIGISTAGKAAMSVWQVRGGSTSDEPTGWKLLRFDQATSAEITDEKSEAPRPGYQRNAKGFSHIVAQLDG